MVSKPLIEHFESFLPLTFEEKELIEVSVVRRKIKRRQFILQQGDICKQYTFVVNGCFRMYGVDAKANDHNVQFGAENDWISDIGSFHSERPSKLYIEAMEPGEVIQIDKKQLYFLYENVPKLNRIFKVIIENKFVEQQNHVLQNISSTAHERYLAFLSQYPKLALRIPNTQIASYIGITPEFLSKIRKEISNRKS